jgi:pimeloyl-ACP methyl ester carboxylesterase
MPLFGLLRMWVVGLVAVALWVAVGLLARDWYRHLPDPRPQFVTPAGEVIPAAGPEPSFADRVAAWRPGADRPTADLAGALFLTLLGVGGGRVFWWLVLPKGKDDPRHERGGEIHRIRRPDGSELHVEVFGRTDGPTVVLTHGWGATVTEWYYLRRQFGDRYRLVAWDLPSLGKSKGPDDRDYGLERLAADLRAVLDEAGGGPAVLLGHSIGGMILLQYAKQFPDDLGDRVVGLVPVHTTHTNPLKTTRFAGLFTALQKPVLEPLGYAMIALSPVVWLMNALSYLNGTLHASNYSQLFSWTGTWGQLEFASRYALHIWPASYARGTLAMFRFHATDALARVAVPTLVVAAARDKMTTHEASEDIRRLVPGAGLATLTPAGHMGLIQRHEEFGRYVAAFLDRCFGGATAGREVAGAVR